MLPLSLKSCRVRAVLALASVMLAGLYAATPSRAAPVWDGDTSVTWSVGGNWDTGSAPSTSENAVFSTASPANQPTVATSTTILGLVLDVTPTITINSGITLTLGSGGTITGDGGLVKAGSGTIAITTASGHTFAGGLTINGGTVNLQGTSSSNNALGTSNITINSGTLQIGGTEIATNTTGGPQTPGLRNLGNKIVIGASGGTINGPGSGGYDTGTILGAVDLGGALRVTSDNGGNTYGMTVDGIVTLKQDSVQTLRWQNDTGHNGSDYISGNIVDGTGGAGNSLRLAVTGKSLFVSGLGNTYAGGTIVEAGSANTLYVNASSSLGTGNLMVQAGGRIGLANITGTGTACNLASAATITAEAGGAVGIGRSWGFNVTGTRTLNSSIITFSGTYSTADMRVGAAITGTGISPGTTIISIDGPTQITISQNAISGGSAAYTISSNGESNRSAANRFSAASAGIYGIEGTHGYNLDMSTLGNGQMFLGSVSGGTYSGTSLTAGTGSTYRLGGGTSSGGLTNFLLTGANALTGNNDVIVGSGLNTNASYGRVIIGASQDVVGSITINTDGLLATKITGGTPFGNASNSIEVFGKLAATGANGVFSTGVIDNTTFRPGSTLEFNNLPDYANASGGNNTDRWDDSKALALNGSTVLLSGARKADSAETIGGVTFNGNAQVQVRRRVKIT